MPKLNETCSLKEYAESLEENARIGRNNHLFFYRSWYMDRFPFPENSKVLDAGAWVGASSITWAKRGHEVTAIEAADTYCKTFRKNVSRQTPEIQERITLFHGLIEEFDGEGFDVAVCTETWGHFLDPSAVMQSLHRALKPGGQLFVAQPQEHFEQDRTPINGDRLLRLMEDAGFEARIEPCDCGIHASQNLGFGVKP
jgi:2-polyprenyl-3-methyl-5-hydroxy-6-metoxy-1,4-benzoquinol methylase